MMAGVVADMASNDFEYRDAPEYGERHINAKIGKIPEGWDRGCRNETPAGCYRGRCKQKPSTLNKRATLPCHSGNVAGKMLSWRAFGGIFRSGCPHVLFI